METLSEKLLELKELGRLRALRQKWFEPSEKQKHQCGHVGNRGDQINCFHLNLVHQRLIRN